MATAAVRQIDTSDPLWPRVRETFPEAVGWINNPDDDGNYRFFVATDEQGKFLGGSVIDVTEMGFGPLAGVPVGFLENLCVLMPYRRRGIGTALLRAVLDHAWACNCDSVRSTVDYENTPALKLYQKSGFGFVPDEVPGVDPPETQYTIVAIHPARVNGGYASPQ